ncbi:MAG: aminotransferase class I/II-fold pyridoxal phosphate-dependent enzyme [Lachnospiraceae bacterium]
MKSLYQQLAEYGDSDYYGFHMPGHKRNNNIIKADLPYQIDISEIEGFDDLNHPQGILKEAQKQAARVYGAEESHFLINGSTAGILSAIMGSTKRGSKILIARNCHKSVYNAVLMKELNPEYLYPLYYEDHGLNGEVRVDDVVQTLEQVPGIEAVVVVSPTYEGVVSDIPAIAAAVHERGIPLIVDQAHGAHFGFHPDFPDSANKEGADIVIHSLHKTLPAMTQTGLLHINGNIAPRENIRAHLQMLQSSSPSYPLMAGIDACIRLLKQEGTIRFGQYTENLTEFRREMKELKKLRLVETPIQDPSKLVISTTGTDITGKELFDRLLSEYHLQLEMAAGSYALALTSIADTKAGFDRLAHALKEIDATLNCGAQSVKLNRLPHLDKLYTEAEAQNFPQAARVSLPWEQSVGYSALERAYLYPPGIPLIVPGERITAPAVSILQQYRMMGFEIKGLKETGKIEVLKDG